MWPLRNYHRNLHTEAFIYKEQSFLFSTPTISFHKILLLGPTVVGLMNKNMVKPHDQLVLVSFTHCCASTSSLSTS